MRLAIARKTLADVRTSTIWVGVVSAAMGIFLVLLFPSYRDSLEGFEFPDAFAAFFGEAGPITTPAGFLSAEFFSWIPLLLVTVAIIGGTGAIAGEEAAGTLDLLLAQPISRRNLLLQKSLALAVAVTLAALAAYPAFLLGTLLVDFDISAGRLFAAVLNMVPITLLYLGLALLGSAALPGRSGAAALSIGAVVAAYFLNTVGAAVESLETARKLSPFYWADGGHVLAHGFDWPRTLALLAIAAALLVAALEAFERREIAAGKREGGVIDRVMRLVRRR